MGYDNRLEEEVWSAPDKYVCTDCVEDDYLKMIISGNLAKRKCDYCGKGSRGYIAAPVDSILGPVASAIYYYFNDPVNGGVPYDEGLVFDATHSTGDALYSIGLECHEQLFDDLANSFRNDWWIETADGFWAASHTSEIMTWAWEKFIRTVKHHTRYFFSTITPAGHEPEKYAPTALLSSIGQAVSGLELIDSLPAGTLLYRVRERSNEAIWPLNSTELGAPPNEIALAQRMNPAGISYFYLAKERTTALAEVLSKPPCRAAVGSFRTRKNLILLDLSQRPILPSIFDSEKHNEREYLMFLYRFVDEISKPVQKDGRVHIDYVPSQVVSEYFAKVFQWGGDRFLDGLAYPSAVRPGGINIVIFPAQRGRDGFMELVEFVSAEEVTFDHWPDFLKAIQ